jgi:hypothetical protein
MLTDSRITLLQTFLGSLPEEVTARLANAIEFDRLVDGKALPHELILEGLRPVLRATDGARRTPTPLRLFCKPFEDLLVNIPRTDKQRGRILRKAVMPVWHWLGQHLLIQETARYCQDVRALLLASKPAAALARAEQFWPLAGSTMAVAFAADRARAVALLGGEAVAADAADMAVVLQSGSAMLAVQALLPKPTPSLNEELLWGLRHICDAVLVHNADAAPLVSVVAMRRLAKPWEALKLATLITRQSTDSLISSTDMGLAGDVLFTDMEESRVAIMELRQPVFDAALLISHVAAFTNISSAIVKEVEILRSGRWGQRLLKDRAAVGATMETFMERAPKEIAGALPTHKAGYSGGSRVPNFGKPVEPERQARALRYANVMAGTRHLAVAGSFAAKHGKAMDEITMMLRSYCEDVLKELRSAEGPRRAVVEAQFQLSLELTKLLAEDGEAEFLARRGKAAGAQVAA